MMMRDKTIVPKTASISIEKIARILQKEVLEENKINT